MLVDPSSLAVLLAHIRLILIHLWLTDLFFPHYPVILILLGMACLLDYQFLNFILLFLSALHMLLK